MAAQHNDTDPTKERLLIEAERLFADKGFEAVSVREITAAAETNTAAVNYHFGSKHNLYMEVFRQRWIPRAAQNFHMLVELQDNPDATVEEAIQCFISCFMDGPFSDHNERTIHSRLIFKEIDSPTGAYQIVVEEVIAPFYEIMIKIAQRAMPNITREQALFKCMSLFGQMIYFSHAQSIVEAVMGHDFMQNIAPKVIDHIYTFSVNGFKTNGERQ